MLNWGLRGTASPVFVVGIPDIYELCKEAGMPEPEFDFVTNFNFVEIAHARQC